MKKQLILTKSMILDSDCSLYLKLRVYRMFTTYQSIVLEKGDVPRSVVVNLDAAAFNSMSGVAMSDVLGVSRQTWAKYKQMLVKPKLHYNSLDEHFTLMPFEVFDMFIVWLDTVAATFNAKEALLRFYCYMYFHAGQFQGEYQQSQENIAIELGTSVKLINQRLKLLRDAGWLERRGTYKFTGDQTWCYKYAVPEHLRATEIFN